MELKNNAFIEFLDPKNMGIDTKSNTFCKIAHIQKKSQKIGILPKKSSIMSCRPQYSENLSLELKNNVLIEFLDPKNMGVDTEITVISKIVNLQSKIIKTIFIFS